MIISRQGTNSSLNMLRLGTASTPKTTCKHVQDGMYVVKGKYSKYAEDSKNAKEVAFVEEGHSMLLAKEGNDKPLAKDGNWARYDNEPLATRAIGQVCCTR
jgi:hypothetical protein